MSAGSHFFTIYNCLLHIYLQFIVNEVMEAAPCGFGVVEYICCISLNVIKSNKWKQVGVCLLMLWHWWWKSMTQEPPQVAHKVTRSSRKSACWTNTISSESTVIQELRRAVCKVVRLSRKTACWGYTIRGESLWPMNHLGQHMRWQCLEGILKVHHHHQMHSHLITIKR